ncbi:hypothetical protein [Streptomyces sp. AK02-04a]|uniref:hypothetical protein n=1 Tax=Streptomyces sp. AK02-04a TaxID=3028649 RepID=UPI0029BD470C|nr:hypothetical protein [Streptomyces sp. AK02-04a]MDX3759281.1 hypothetical protein [Streptomyces sp. AK02-04a]
MSTVSQTPDAGPVRVIPLYEAPLASVFVDRDGDVWVPSGHTSSGEVLLACPQPSNPEDAGEGESFAWTLRLVEAGFGPLTARSAVSA